MKKHQFTKLAIIAMLATVLSVSSACTQTSTPTSEKDSNGTVTSENSSEQIISADTVEYANAYLKAVNSLYYNGIADYFTFVNLDGDDVPDMVAGKAYDGFETPVFLYSFYNGEAKRVMESRVGIEGHTFSFSEGQGLVYATRSWDGVTMEEVYEWKDGELKDYKTFSDIDNEMLDEQGFFIDEKNVTEDEFWKEFNDFTAAHNPYVGIWGDYITKDSRVEPHDSNESIFYEEGSREDCMTYSETVQYLTGLGATQKNGEWKEAYAKLITQFWDANREKENEYLMVGFQLLYFDEDNIPELMAEIDGQFNLYTYKDSGIELLNTYSQDEYMNVFFSDEMTKKFGYIVFLNSTQILYRMLDNPFMDEKDREIYTAYGSVIEENLPEVQYQTGYINDDDIPDLISVWYGENETKKDYAQFELFKVRTIKGGAAEEVFHGICYGGYFEKKDYVSAFPGDSIELIGGYMPVFEKGKILAEYGAYEYEEIDGKPDPYAEGGIRYFVYDDKNGTKSISKAEYESIVASFGPITERNLLYGPEMLMQLAGFDAKAGEDYSGLIRFSEEQDSSAGEEPATEDDIPERICLYMVEVTASDGYVNFREGPGTNYNVITKINNGEMMEAYDESADRKWVQVEYNGQSGWVAMSQVEIR